MAYRELPHPAPHVACVWERDPAAEPSRHRVLPDACVDVVWVGDRLVVAGPATAPVLAVVEPGASVFGVRFRIGAAGAVLGIPASELLDRTIALEDVWGARGEAIAEQVAAAPTPAALATALRSPADPFDPLVRACVLDTPRRRLGIGDRQLRRRFAAAVGYGPRTLQRVLRFQRFLSLASPPGADLARLALDAGYADQAHLTRECRRLAGLTPATLVASGAGPAGERSESFNTAASAAGRLAP